ncbi:hypothetical protein B0T21DRAFT_401926 [Apiosordaria backusii]|uniref:DUF676 domain-containing protein n=1 Tax=Apiosordaria backusii TaxID=314023 RepID=A0AA40BLK0_9PEZI|nr:hypothetical protein B0T21DRAFT_401926 [Apiosordaria backusii]
MGQTDFAQALLIWNGIFTNDANTDTLAFILDHKSDLALFLINLLEPAKLYDTALGSPTSQNTHASYRRYNELDLTKARNRHAVICQLQRLAVSLSRILLMGKNGQSLEQLPMNTELRSDFDDDNRISLIPSTLSVTAPASWWARSTSYGEKWLFVNGIGGEYFWLQLYCEKLRDTYRRNILGVFNRSDGILWDLVECAGERDINGRQTLIRRTESSRAAQRTLERELSAALQNRESDGFIVMIAYSQGCLLLRHVLQEFAREDSHREAMANRLRVFTFGNPSVDWMGTDAQGISAPLCERVNYTEHFANGQDFVAKLGVLRTNQEEALRNAGYIHERSSVFINHARDWVGHLFGTQYSLRVEDYEDGGHSKLLACAGGRAMRR